MRVEMVHLREIRMKLKFPFETSFGRTFERRILLVEVRVDGVTGWGEVVAGENPFYSPETTDTAWHILRDFCWPAIKGREFNTAADVWPLLEQIRGHNMAKAGLETAIWDAEAKQKGVPLSKLLGGTLQEISSGVSIGIQSDNSRITEKVEAELAAGYQRIKIKIKPGKDIEPVALLRERFPAHPTDG